jgi:hypothetical protein
MLQVFSCVDSEPSRQLPSRISPVDLSLAGFREIVFRSDDKDVRLIGDVSQFRDPISNVFKALKIRDIVEDQRDVCACRRRGELGVI